MNNCELLEKNCKWEDALLCYENRYKQYLEHKDLEKIGWCQSRLSLYDDAINTFTKLLKYDNSYKTDYYIGFQYYMKQDWINAIKWYESCLSKFPSYIKALIRCAYAYIKTNKLNQADSLLNKCIDNLYQLEKVKSEASSVFFYKGKIAFKRNKYDKALSYFKQAYNYEKKEDTRYNIAKCCYELKDYSETIKLLSSIKIDSNRKELLIHCYIALEEFDKIDYSMKKIINNKKYILMDFSEYYITKGECIKAIAINNYLLDCRSCFKQYHKIHFLNGLAYSRLKDYSSSKESYNKANQAKIERYKAPYQEAIFCINEIENNRLDSQPEVDNYTLKFGQIINYNSEKGFGFISGENNESTFFHITDYPYRQKPVENQYIFYEIIISDNKKTKAININLFNF